MIVTRMAWGDADKTEAMICLELRKRNSPCPAAFVHAMLPVIQWMQTHTGARTTATIENLAITVEMCYFGSLDHFTDT